MTGERMGDLYQAIWRVTGRRQFLLIALAVLVAALAALPLKFQQLAINSLVYGGDWRLLAWSCAGFLGALALSAGLKFLLGLRMATVGEGVVLQLRERLYRNAVHDQAHAAADLPKRGALVAMLAAEAEQVGAFAGAAFASPVRPCLMSASPCQRHASGGASG